MLMVNLSWRGLAVPGRRIDDLLDKSDCRRRLDAPELPISAKDMCLTNMAIDDRNEAS
jgi:hypothetical protein